MEIKQNHYKDTVIYACDVILKNLKNALREKLDKLELGITSEQLVVLDTINAYKDIYQQQLAEILMKDKSNTTRIIKILEDKNLITKTVGKNKNRLIYTLKVTDDGKKILEKAMPKMKTFIEELFTNLSNNDVDTLHLMADIIRKDLSV